MIVTIELLCEFDWPKPYTRLKENWDGLGPSGHINGIVFSADGQTMVSAGSNQEGPGGEAELFVWDWPARQVKYSLIPPPSYGISRFATSSEGTVFATMQNLNDTVKVWRLP